MDPWVVGILPVRVGMVLVLVGMVLLLVLQGRASVHLKQYTNQLYNILTLLVGHIFCLITSHAQEFK